MAGLLTLEALCRRLNLDEEAKERLDLYAAMLLRWQRRINLIGSSTVPDLWNRHFLDSAQLLPLIPPQAKILLDLGSGAGFPGLVLALLGAPNVHLVESDSRKCAFLHEAARRTGVSVTVHACRIEALKPFPVDVVSARALASVRQLLEIAQPFMRLETFCLFPKGQNAELELTEARTLWNMRVERFPSQTQPEATLLRLSEVHREH